MKRTIFSAVALLLGSMAGCGSSTPAPAGPCATVTCSASQFCDAASGACKTASACSGVTCAAGTVCDGSSSATMGTCIATTCGVGQCTNGQVCNQATATCVNPGVPALSVQIDRMGRPAVNTALTNPYDAYPAANPETSDTTKARYNADPGPAATWATNWIPAIKANIAVLDGLDAGVCGNQFAYSATAPYVALSTVLANDTLLVDTSKTTCAQYLAVEAGVATDCGGRQLSYDVVDTTYSALAVGALSGVSDGIAQTSVPATTFPFFLPPI